MKLKDVFSPILFIVLGIAFLSVSLWLLLSKSENVNAIKAKYKLGGMILSLSFFTTACNPPIVTCYDPLPPSNTVFSSQLFNGGLLSGDTIFMQIFDPTYSYFSYNFTDSMKTNELQKGLIQKSADSIHYIVPITYSQSYNGLVYVNIYGESTNEAKMKELVFTGTFQLNEVQN